MPAPKGNKFAIGNSGQAKKYSSAKKLQEDIDAYFRWCDENPYKINHTSQIVTEKVNRKVVKRPLLVDNVRPYSFEGLAYHLGITTRTLVNYEKQLGYEEFFHTIERARQKINQQRVELASIGVFKEGFTKFLLINNNSQDYADKVEHKNTNTNINFNSGPMTKEEIREISEALEDEC
jgi:hypothetical protein